MLTRSFMTPNSAKDLLAYTPMIHSRMFIETPKFRDHHFQPTRSGLASLPTKEAGALQPHTYLDGNPSIDRPLIVQFCANNPDELLEAARYVEPFCDAVDLNLGCPQGIARKGHYGAFLQEDWELVYKLVNVLHENLSVPVTAKIRILQTREKTLEYARTVLAAGASILTVHGRQRDQKGHKTGLADWSMLRYLRDNLPPDTVIFANGNILRQEDISRCLEQTGADGVMSAEGNLYDPSIFSEPPAVGNEGREYWRGKNGRGGYRMDAVFRRYMDILYLYVLEKHSPKRKPLFIPSDTQIDSDGVGETKLEKDDGQPPSKRQKRDDKQQKTTSPNLLSMQAHLFHLLRPLVAKHTNVRDALARCRAGDIPAFENVLSLVEQAVHEGILEYERHPEIYDNALDDRVFKAEKKEEVERSEESSVAAVRACRRPWWVCQPYVRPLPKEALEKGSLTLSKKEKKKSDEECRDTNATDEELEGRSERERLDQVDNMDKSQIPREGMVCG